MSEIKLNLLDSQTIIIATVHGAVGDALVAALSAEPETIDELEAALKRFEKCETIPASSLSRHARYDIDEEPYDAGILVIDLAARIVACESTYSLPGRDGSVDYHDGTQCTGFPLHYRLSSDWLFLRSIEDYLARCKERLRQRAALKPLDARAVLYGEPLLHFIVQNIELLNVRPVDVRYALACRDLRDGDDEGEDNLLAEAVVDIHRRWLMTPREDLDGKSPREILFAKQDLINFDLNSRMDQWSYFLEQPPALSRDSHAYRYAGFGTHEWVMYYDLVRFLIWEAVDRVRRRPGLDETRPGLDETPPGLDVPLSFSPSFSLGLCGTEQSETVSTVSNQNAALTAELEALKLTWLTEPNPHLDGYIPFQVIDNERRRLPEAMTGRSMVVDEDCPCCKMMGDESEAGLGVYFCHFDGCNMEDEFAFSWHATLEEWEEEQRKNAEWDREWELKRKDREERIAH